MTQFKNHQWRWLHRHIHWNVQNSKNFAWSKARNGTIRRTIKWVCSYWRKVHCTSDDTFQVYISSKHFCSSNQKSRFDHPTNCKKKTRFDFYISVYNALRCQCQQQYDIFINHDLWENVVEPLCDRTHSQADFTSQPPPLPLKCIHTQAFFTFTFTYFSSQS